MLYIFTIENGLYYYFSDGPAARRKIFRKLLELISDEGLGKKSLNVVLFGWRNGRKIEIRQVIFGQWPVVVVHCKRGSNRVLRSAVLSFSPMLCRAYYISKCLSSNAYFSVSEDTLSVRLRGLSPFIWGGECNRTASL